MFNNKKAILFFLFLSTMVFILLIFRISEFTSDYKNNKSYLFNIHILERLDRVFGLVDKEKSLTIVYLKTQNEINFNNLNDARYELKIYLQKLLIYIPKKKKFNVLEGRLKEILINLNRVQFSVDSANFTYLGSVTDDYNQNVIEKLTYIVNKAIELLPLQYGIDLLKKEELLLLAKVEKTLVNTNSEIEKEIFAYVLISTLFLFLILFLLYGFKAIKQHRIELEATLKEIEEDLSDKQRLEIQEVLKKNNTLEVYKFLAKTIKEPNMAKDQFLANMSHEVRTPLNGIMGFTALLQTTELTEEQKEFLEIIANSSNNLLTIINDVLDFSKVSSGHFEVENVAFNIIEKIEATIESYSEKVSKKDISLGVYLEPSLPLSVLGDAARIGQVLLNLLDNAVKFTPENGIVNVSLTVLSQSTQKVSIRFSVEDTGIGIEKSKQKEIFDAFSQADISTNRKFGGTGLGLTISRKFVELMGGRLELDSERLVGSRFYFDLTLDIDKEHAKRERPDFSELKVAYLTEGKNISSVIDENIKSYITYTQASYQSYDEKELLNLPIESLPDILFINHAYAKNEKALNRFIELPTKLILISNSKVNEYKNIKRELIHKVINAPMNFSKMMKVLEREYCPTLNNVLLYKDSKLSGKIYYSILESLGYEVEIYYSVYEFKKQLETKKYKYALFDDKITNNEIMTQIIKNNGAVPFLFSEEKGNHTCCQVLDYSIDANTLEAELKRA